MARIIYGNIVTDASGKQGGMVYSRNRYGAYMRNKTSPVQPNTPEQQQAKATLAYLSQRWRGLTDVQRYGWAKGSEQYPQTNKFGDVVFLSGAALFNKLNAGVYSATGGTIDDCPSPATLSLFTLDGFTYSRALGTATLDLTPVNNNADDSMVVYMTGPLSAGVSYYKNRLIRVGVYPNADWSTGALVITAEMFALFGYPTAGTTQPPVGTRFGFSIYTVNNITGQKTIAQNLIGIAA